MTHERWSHLAHWGLLTLIFLLPWQARWIITGDASWPYGQISLYATQLLLFAVVAATLLSKPDWKNLRRYWPAWLLEFWTIAAVVWSANQGVALYHASLIICAVLLGECVLMLRPDPKRIATVLFGAGVIQALIAISQFASQHVFASAILGLAEHTAAAGHAVLQTGSGLIMRAYGTLPHPNILGAWLAVGWLCGLAIRIPMGRGTRGETQRAASIRMILSAGLGIIAMGLLMTFSRGAWLATAVGTIWIIIVAGKQISWRRAAASGTVIIIAVAALALPLAGIIGGRLPGNSAALEQLSYSDRRQSLANGWRLLKDSPLIGHGVPDTAEPPHLVPLAIAVDLGLIGLIFALLLGWTMRPQLLSWYAPLWAVPLIAGLVDHHWWTLWAGMALGIIVLALAKADQ